MEVKSWHQLRARWYKEARERREAHYSYIVRNRLYDEAYEKCRRDIKYFINYYCPTYDPRNAEVNLPTTIPFWMTPHQERFIDFLFQHLHTGTNGLVEKSRAEGLSWLMIYFAVYHLLFYDGFKTGFGSYKETKVDHIGDLDSLFEKARFCLKRLPEFIMERQEVETNFERIVNHANGSAMTGEVGDDIGRGGRSSIYMVDEHASLPNPKQVEHSLAENTSCIIYGSTPKGTNNLFYKKRMSMSDDDIFTFHWRNNPMKNDSWYANMERKFDAVTIAQEVDIDYTASIEGIVIPAVWVQKAVNFDLNSREVTDISHAGVDVGGGKGQGESVYVERIGSTVAMIDTSTTVEPTDWALHCANIARNSGVQMFKYDAVGVGGPMGGTISKMEPAPTFRHIPVISGSSPTDKKYDDNEKLTAKDRFANLRAEMWWSLRERFRKTYEHRSDSPENAHKSYNEDEMISIPDDQVLITQLSQPTMEYSTTGKIIIESKEEMRKRGISSPDRADALVYCYADLKPKIQTVPAGSR